MNRVVESDRYGSRSIASRAAGGSGGGNVDDILKRLGAVEVSVNDIRALVSALTAVVPHLATKAEVSALSGNVDALRGELKADMPHLATKAEVNALRGELKADMPHLATKAEVNALRGELKADMHAMESSLIKWIVGTAIASVAVASAIASVVAKFVG
jgi:HAMP domain-containing protein